MYEIDGRVLIRTVHSCGRAGIEDSAVSVVDGFPDVEAGQLGDAIRAAPARCREVPWPTSWPALSQYARPLLEHSPRRYRSYRSWQRGARYVTLTATAETIHLKRRHPDLGRGAWEPMPPRPDDDTWTYDMSIPGNTDPADLGRAVLTTLQPPPLRAT